MTEEKHALSESQEYVLFDTEDEARHEFLHGYCHALTVALHKASGWLCVLFIAGEGGAIHSAVQAPNGQYLDGAGLRDLAAVEKSYRSRLQVANTTVEAIVDLYDLDEEQDAEYKDALIYVEKLLKRSSIFSTASLS